MPTKSLVQSWIEEAEAAAIQTPVEPAKKIYDTKLVAWIDILAMREKICSSEAEEVFEIMGGLQRFVDNSCEPLYASGKLNYLQISDGFIIVADLECLNEIFCILCEIQWHVLIHTKMLIRGALTSGKISMSDDSKLIIGPAFVEAFALESDSAIFPRILISNHLWSNLAIEQTELQYVRKDTDNFYYLDFINYMIKRDKINSSKLTHILQTEGVIKYLCDSYNQNIGTRVKVAQKHGWVISKLSEHKVKVI